MKKIAMLIATLSITLFSVSAITQANEGIITIAVAADWPPMEFIENGVVKGYSTDYFTAVAKEAGYEAKFINMSWDELFNKLQSGEVDAVVASVTITNERRQKYEFSIPYYIVRQSLLVPADSPLVNVRQIQGRKTGTMKDTTGTEIVEKIVGSPSAAFEKSSAGDLAKAQSITFPTVEEAVKAMLEGKIDAVICEDVVANNFLSTAGVGAKLKIASVVATPGAEELYGAVIKKGNFKILVAINDGIKAVKAKGLEAELLHKWFPASK